MRSSRPSSANPGGLGVTLYDIWRAARLVCACLRWGVPALVLVLLKRGPAGVRGRYLRRFAESMGATYLKLGQFLAGRIDLFDAAALEQLRALFEGVAPIAYTDICRVVTAELCAPLETAFSYFDTRCLASGSVAQVHRARAHSGQWVAVKVQRPGVERQFDSDIRMLACIAGAADRLGAFGAMSARAVVDEFAAFTRRELDFELEACALREARARGTGRVTIPRVFSALSARRVLTMELIVGESVGAFIGRSSASMAPATATEQGARVVLLSALDALAAECLHELFGTGLFHADPHPGNVILEPSGAVALIDFGLYGRLRPKDRELFAESIQHLAMADFERCCRCYEQISRPTSDTDLSAYRRDVRAVLVAWREAMAATGSAQAHPDRHPARFMAAVLVAMRRHSVELAPDQILFWRALANLHSTVLQLPVEYDLLGQLRRYFSGRAERVLLGSLEKAARALADGESALISRRAAAQVSHQLLREGPIVETAKRVGGGQERALPVLAIGCIGALGLALNGASGLALGGALIGLAGGVFLLATSGGVTHS